MKPTSPWNSIIWHEDGLPFSPQFDDHYYSRNDGRAETMHVFLKGNQLPERWADADHFYIGELGFGTGLNFLQTWHCWIEHRKKGQQLTFVSVEAFPLDQRDVQRALTPWPQLSPLSEKLLNQWPHLFPQNMTVQQRATPPSPLALDEQTSLQVFYGLAEESIKDFPLIHAWYLDGFAPSKNPAMWSKDVLCDVGARTATQGTCASYTAAGWVRRHLQEAGFSMEKRQGFGTKRDMIAGIKQ